MSPEETTTYTITAVNEAGSTQKMTKVIVISKRNDITNKPVIKEFYVDPEKIGASGSSILVWSVYDAESVSIDPRIGKVGLNGIESVSPEETTTYTITAVNEAGSARKTVNIEVIEPESTKILYDFIQNADLAWWSNGHISLRFGGSDTDSDGFVLCRDDYELSDGSRPSRVLETHPEWIDHGIIFGQYPMDQIDYVVQPNDHISGKVAFLKGALAGEVTFRIHLMARENRVDIKIVNIPLSYEDGVKSFDYPLSEHSGMKVDYVALVVDAGESSAQDWAVWHDVKLIRG